MCLREAVMASESGSANLKEELKPEAVQQRVRNKKSPLKPKFQRACVVKESVD